MKLQEQTSRKIGKKKYSKFIIIIPPKIIRAFGWEHGEELECEVEEKEKKLIISKKRLRR